jgi:hypothetical protein
VVERSGYFPLRIVTIKLPLLRTLQDIVLLFVHPTPPALKISLAHMAADLFGSDYFVHPTPPALKISLAHMAADLFGSDYNVPPRCRVLKLQTIYVSLIRQPC